MFYSAITPMLPGYVDDLSLSKGQAGLLAGSYAAGTLAAALPAGWLASRWGARRTVLLGLGLLGVSCLAFGFGDSYGVLVGARLAQGVAGASAWAAGLSWLIAAAPRERRGELIGTALGVAIAGALGGPVVGAAAELVGSELVFSTVAVISAGLAAAVLATPAPPVAEQTAGVLRALGARRVLAGAWLVMLPGAFFGLFSVLTPLRLDDLGVSAAGVGAVFLGAAAVEALASPMVGRLSDRRGRLLPIRVGLLGIAVAAVVLPAPDATWLLVACALGAAAVAGVMWAPAMALLSDGAEGAGVAQGVAFGLVNLAWAGGQMTGAGVGSRIADASADAVPYAVVAVLSAVTLVVLMRRPARVAAPA
jgi:MFS family permease